MTKLSTRYTPECARRIAKLPPEIKRLVRSNIDSLLKSPTSGTELTGDLEGYRSLRVRRYRIIYRINDAARYLEFYYVGHRRDVYERLRSLLADRN